ncbi:MAG: zinc-dependent metalloprotease, partial [Planctomycetota bacterium]
MTTEGGRMRTEKGAGSKRRVRAGVLTGLVGLAGGLGVAGSVIAEPFSAPDEDGISVVRSEDGTEALTVDMDMVRQLMGGGAPRQAASSGGKKSWKSVSEGFEPVISTTNGGSFYGIWINRKTNQMLAELPRGYERQSHFFAMTVAGGETFAGLQAADMYVKWQKINDRMALVMPQLGVRSSGDQESKDSVNMIFTDRVLLDVPIVCDGPNGQPVIDMDALLVGKATDFFGGRARGLNRNLATIASAKAFPENVELAFTAPAAGGQLKTFHYSLSHIKGSQGFRPREADQRVGYFTTAYQDFGKFDSQEVERRYINRWHIEKADKSLKMSPPKEPIVFFVEHTVPVRYRRWVREGIEYWNKAYENVGISGAIEVRFQDKRTGAYMDKDPEDVRHNFIRWLSNDVATAIGPSRVNPKTGEILDADVVLTDGWIRVYGYRWEDLMPSLAMEGMGPDAMAWLERNPRWDPRLRLAAPSERDTMLAERARRGVLAYGGHPAAQGDTSLLGDDAFDGLGGRISQVNGKCFAAEGMALNLATMRMYLEMIDVIRLRQRGEEPATEAGAAIAASMPEIDEDTLEMIRKQLEANPEMMAMIPEQYRAFLMGEEKPEEVVEDEAAGEDEGEDKPETPEQEPGDTIDGVPEWFVGPALAELVAHEVGHTLGLRHNFRASAYFDLDEINSEEVKGKEPWSMSVMDYNGVNIRMPGSGEIQGDYSVIDIGPYDMWAIEYGYGSGDPAKVAEKASDPRLNYGTDEDTWGPDPRDRRYDLSADPLDYAKNQMELVTALRTSLLKDYVEDGESWSQVRRGYRIAQGQHVSAVSMMANWIGSAYVSRAKKGQPDSGAPIQIVEAEKQRDALRFVVENTFRDEAFGITPELLSYMTVDKWWGPRSSGSIFQDPAFPLHDQILGVQSAALTMILNPQTLQRVFDYEAFIPADEDTLTLAEVLETVTGEIWSELDGSADNGFTVRKPMISSMRRNLQREHLGRLIDLSLMDGGFSASETPSRQLARVHLKGLHNKIGEVVESGHADAYSEAHLMEAHKRIEEALDAEYIYNMPEFNAMSLLPMLFGQEAQDNAE